MLNSTYFFHTPNVWCVHKLWMVVYIILISTKDRYKKLNSTLVNFNGMQTQVIKSPRIVDMTTILVLLLCL
jgi:hypothetical protein